MNKYKFTPIEEVISAFQKGQMVLMVDDDDRENEGDVVVATEFIDEKHIAFMFQEAKGLICVSISEETAQKLNIPPQVLTNSAIHQTAFTVSINHIKFIDSAITAKARAETMRRLVAEDANAEEFVTPGYVYPLITNPKGVAGRRGQTEGSFDLARLAGLAPSGVICEILNSDGTMMRGEDLMNFAKKFSLPFTSVEEILKYRISNKLILRKTAEGKKEIEFGEFNIVIFQDDITNKEHIALVYGTVREDAVPLLRIHSECLTGDVFGSRRCDCGAQLERAMQMIVKEGSGIILYLRQEGRGIGLSNKLKAYKLQDEGLDTVEANIKLGFEADVRDFTCAAEILKEMKIKEVRLITNNPKKLKKLNDLGIVVKERVSIVVEPDEYSKEYLETKRTKLGHML